MEQRTKFGIGAIGTGLTTITCIGFFAKALLPDIIVFGPLWLVVCMIAVTVYAPLFFCNSMLHEVTSRPRNTDTYKYTEPEGVSVVMYVLLTVITLVITPMILWFTRDMYHVYDPRDYQTSIAIIGCLLACAVIFEYLCLKKWYEQQEFAA